MFDRSRVALPGIAALLFGCAGSSSDPSPVEQRCGPYQPCIAPAVCDPIRSVCVAPDAGVQPRNEAGIPIDGPPVTPTPEDGPVTKGDLPEQPDPDGSVVPRCPDDEQECDGKCVNTRVNLQHCGGCNNSCGPMSGSHALCNSGTCECYSPYENCDGDWSNGCECSTGCDGTQCGSTSCDPDTAGDCGTDQKQYCSMVDRQCKICSQGWMNCDNMGSSCDCKITSYSCVGDKCQ